MSSEKTSRRHSSAWLVLWFSSHDDYFDRLKLPCFVCALPPRLGDGSVAAILQVLWAMLRPTKLREKISWGCNQQWPRGFVQQDRRGGPIMVGDDPFLRAQKVHNLRVRTSKRGDENLYFIIPARYGIGPDGFKNSSITPARSMVFRQGDEFPQPYPGIVHQPEI